LIKEIPKSSPKNDFEQRRDPKNEDRDKGAWGKRRTNDQSSFERNKDEDRDKDWGRGKTNDQSFERNKDSKQHQQQERVKNDQSDNKSRPEKSPPVRKNEKKETPPKTAEKSKKGASSDNTDRVNRFSALPVDD